jgi:hypothetical protein
MGSKRGLGCWGRRSRPAGLLASQATAAAPGLRAAQERLYKRIDALAANAEGLARVASLGEEASPAAATAAADAPGAGVEDGEEEGEISLGEGTRAVPVHSVPLA